MFGSGAKTIGTITISERQRMDLRGLSRTIIVLSLLSVRGAVLGTPIRITAVLLTATATTAAATATTASVFGWCAVLGGLYNPYFLFTLFSIFLFFPPSGGSIFF
jgi:hypothetical protein